LITAAKDCKTDVIALQEIRRDGKEEDDEVDKKEKMGCSLYWSGGEQDKGYEFDTGFLVSKKLVVKILEPVNRYLCRLRLKEKFRDVN
jgi:hypothetical protein